MVGITELNEPTVTLGVTAGNHQMEEVEERALEELSTSTNKEFVLYFFSFVKDQKLKQNCVFSSLGTGEIQFLAPTPFFFLFFNRIFG